MTKRLAMMGLVAVLVLGSASVAVAAGGGEATGANPDCPGDCTGQQKQFREQVRADGSETQLQTPVRAQIQDGTGDEKQIRTQAHLQHPVDDQVRARTRAEERVQDPTGDQVQTRMREMNQDGECGRTGDPAQNRAQERGHDGDGTPSANSRNGDNGNGNGGK